MAKFQLKDLVLALVNEGLSNREVAEKAKDGQIPLFVEGVGYDPQKREFIPIPVKEYPPIDYRRLCEHA